MLAIASPPGWSDPTGPARPHCSPTPDRVVTVEDRDVWVHGNGFATYTQARRDRSDRLDERRRRWNDEHRKLTTLVHTLRQTAARNDSVASAYRAARTRLGRFEQAEPPQRPPKEQNIRVRLRGGRTGKRALICQQLELTGHHRLERNDAMAALARYEIARHLEPALRHPLRRPAGPAADPAARTRRRHPSFYSTNPPTTSTSPAPTPCRTGLETFTGTVLAVTHDRWFTAGFDRYLIFIFAADGRVRETDEPVWGERRVDRPR